MYGPHISSLNVYTKVGNQFNGPVWSKSGTQGNKWWNGLVQVSNNNTYQIVFEGVRGSGYQGDIALDDVELQNTACRATVNCDFESPVAQLKKCGWTDLVGDDFNWRIGQGATSSRNTGPSNDHTLGDQRGIFYNKLQPLKDAHQNKVPEFHQSQMRLEKHCWKTTTTTTIVTTIIKAN